MSDTGLLDKKIEKKENFQKFFDYMKCFICEEKVREPVMCPGCQSFACLSCL